MSALLEYMKVLDLTDEGYARLFDVSRPTIRRWREGTTAPHKKIEKSLCKILEREIENVKSTKRTTISYNR